MSQSSYFNHQTASLTVANMGFMLERIAADCDPKQFIRELTQNSIEAVREVGGGDIQWGYDEVLLKNFMARKLSITDNGIGMTAEEMIKHINHLASSTKHQSLSGNFGIGAKITAGVQSPAGLIFQSWKKGSGAMIWFWKDPDTGEYGLRRLRDEKGMEAYWVPVAEKDKPALIGEHGTKVTLIGHDNEHESFLGMDANNPDTVHWLTHYLNSRYVQIEQGISLRVLEKYGDNTSFRTVSGQKKYLDEYSQEKGTIELSDASVHWYLLKEGDHLRKQTQIVESAGHIGVIHDNEMYHKVRGNAGYSALNDFGIIAGPRRVVLYIFPRGQVEPSTARNTLKIDGQALSFHRWAEEFSANMPKALADYQDDLLKQTNDNDAERDIRDKLEKYREWFSLSAYTDGIEKVVETTLGEKPKKPKVKKKDRDPNIKRLNDYRTQEPFNTASNSSHDPSGGEPKHAVLNIPRVVWVSANAHSRSRGDELEDKAAKFMRSQNMIVANADFRVYNDLITKIANHFSDRPQAKPLITTVVKKLYETTLIEHAMRGRNLVQSGPWREDEIEELFSPISMTSAVMPTILLANEIKKLVSLSIGKVKRISDDPMPNRIFS